MVESKNKKLEKKRQAIKAKEAADKKKAEEKSTAYLAVAVAKEVAKLNGGAARAPPPPSQWNSNGAGLNGQGQRDQHAGIPPDYKPLAVVFGQGSKKTLRAEIKKALPQDLRTGTSFLLPLWYLASHSDSHSRTWHNRFSSVVAHAVAWC